MTEDLRHHATAHMALHCGIVLLGTDGSCVVASPPEISINTQQFKASRHMLDDQLLLSRYQYHIGAPFACTLALPLRLAAFR